MKKSSFPSLRKGNFWGREEQASEKSNVERNERIDNHHNGEIRNPSEMLETLCIASFLSEIRDPSEILERLCIPFFLDEIRE